MLPIGDDNTYRRSTPYVNYGLIVVNILVFLLELQNGDSFIVRWSFVPSRFLANPAAELPTLFTAMFMHASWLHLGGNMLYLWIFGDNVEDYYGHARFLFFYLACGLVATFSQLAFNLHSDIPNLGASGAIAGALGSYILLYPQARVRVFQGFMVVGMPAIIVIGLWFVLQLFSGLGSIASTGGGVAYLAHIGGFLAGLLFTGIVRGASRLPRPRY